MEIGMTYEAISRNNIQVAMVFATDGKLDKYNLTVLEDSKNFFPAYNLAVTVREEIYEEYPEIADILKPISTYLNDDIMRRLNYLVDAEGKEPDEVAQQFLEGLGLLN
jgi:osmoprotectant transport system substrate-binding protein